MPPLLGGRSFTIGPFYATPELLIGFAAAVACTIALRFMLQATYLTSRDAMPRKPRPLRPGYATRGA